MALEIQVLCCGVKPVNVKALLIIGTPSVLLTMIIN
jgi:hypothetical protein